MFATTRFLKLDWIKASVGTIALLGALTAHALDVGDKVPDFALEGTDGVIHQLSDYQGKSAVVIAWFPKAYTRGCTIECKSLAENGHLIDEYEVAYFMASVDPIEDNLGFAAENNAQFPLLSDPTKRAAQDFGVLSERGVANRYTYYIDQTGTVVKIDKAINPATSAEDIAATLAELNIPKI